MNERRTRFVDFYLQSGNASDAARKAGYSERSAYSTGERMLRNAEVSAAIEERLKSMASERIAEAEESMTFLTSVMRGEFLEEVATPSGKKISVQIPTAQRIKAAETLLKIQGKFKDKLDVKVDGGQLFIQTLEKISAELEE